MLNFLEYNKFSLCIFRLPQKDFMFSKQKKGNTNAKYYQIFHVQFLYNFNSMIEMLHTWKLHGNCTSNNVIEREIKE